LRASGEWARWPFASGLPARGAVSGAARGGVVSEEPVLVLVRHSLPEMDPARPAREWALSPEGCRRAVQLAAHLAPYRLELIASSEELKAMQTAAILGEELGVAVVVTQGLQEQDRGGTVGLDREAFEDRMARTFGHPGERVFGGESADDARERFTEALDRVLARYAGQRLGVVGHGTVLALFVAAQEGIDAYALWQSLGLPCVFVLSRPKLRLIEWMAEVPLLPRG
jgi:broad specificity phosphatase PhoE